MIGVLTTEDQVSDRLDKVFVEACTWAVFPMKDLSLHPTGDHGKHTQWLPFQLRS